MEAPEVRRSFNDRGSARDWQGALERSDAWADFPSSFLLSTFQAADTKGACPGGETGKRKGLKIPRPHGFAGSSPAPGTRRII